MNTTYRLTSAGLTNNQQSAHYVGGLCPTTKKECLGVKAFSHLDGKIEIVTTATSIRGRQLDNLSSNRQPFFKLLTFNFLLLTFLLLTNTGWGQQVIGTYPGMNGGFEGATIDNTVFASAQSGKWVKNNSTQTIGSESTTVRSGSTSLSATNSSTTGRRIWTPLVTVSSTTSSVTIQYHRRVSNTTNTQQSQQGIGNGTTTGESSSGTYNAPGSVNTWEKITYNRTSFTFTDLAGVIFTRQTGTGGTMFIDDLVMYNGAVDNTAPNSPGAVTVSNPTTSSLDVSWAAASGGVDGGGYVVVRYSSNPNADNDPNQNGIYAVGNTTTNGTGSLVGTIRFIGTGTSFTDNVGLSSGTQYWYKVYAVDKAFNYSAESSGNGTTSAASSTVTFDGNGATSGSMSNQTASTATNLTSNAFTRTGYTFAGWNTAANGSGSSYANAASYPFTASTTLYAQWTANTLTVTYDSQGGSAVSNGSTTTGGSISASPGTPTRSEFNFNGWFVASSGGTAISFPYTHGQTANFTLYAQWSSTSSFSVTYNNNGGTGSQSDATAYSSGATVTVLNQGTMARIGYSFNGWNTAANGSGTSYAAGATFAINVNTTLYAQWTANTLTITYDSQGGSSISSGSTTTGGSIASSPGTPTRSGYTFSGWFAASSGGSAIIFPYTHGQTSNFTLYAQWTANTYTVTFDGNGGGSPSPTSISVTYASTYGALATVTRTGYTFASWNTAANGSGSTITSASTVSITSAQTLYAQWTINSYSITYNGNSNTGGAAPSTQNGNYNSSVTLSGAGTLVRTGFTFNGWNTAANGSGASYAAGASFTIPASNTTLFAQWSLANDFCENAVLITVGGGAVAGTTVGSTFSSPFTTGDDVWYYFTPTCTGTATISTTQTSQDVDLYVYASACPNTNNTGIGTGGETTSLTTESKTVSVTAGTTYYINVTHFSGTSGSNKGSFNITVTNSVSTQFTLSNTGTPAAGNVSVGASNATLYGFSLTPAACSNSFDLTAVSITTTGTATSADLSNFRLYQDVGSNGYDVGDVLLGTVGNISATLSFTGITGQTGIVAARRFLLLADVASGSTPGRTFTGSLSSANVTASASVTGSANGNAQTIQGVAPSLTAAVGATVDGAFDVTFTEDAVWRGAITSITVGGTTLIASAYNKNAAGKITFTPSGSSLLQSSGSKSIVVIATGYNNASVTQAIGVGVATKLGFGTQPAAPSSNGAVLATQPVVLVQDQYGNTVSSSASIAAVAVQGTWTLGGTTTVSAASGTATYSGLTATSSAAVSGATIQFTSTGLTSVTSNGFNIPAPDFISITALNSAVTENFDGMSTGTTSPQGFSIQDGNTTTVTSTLTAQASSGSPTGGGSYNWGQSTSERALGFMYSGGYSGKSVLVKIKNNSGSTINSFSISFDYEQYRRNTATQTFKLQYSTSLTSGWTDVSAGAFTNLTTGTSAYVFSTLIASQSVSSLSFTPSSSISDGGIVYFRWILDGSSSSNGVGIDNFSITGFTSATPPSLTAANGATVDAPFDVTFSDDASWRGAITGVTVDGTPLTAGYTVSAGKITFTPSLSNPANLLQTSGSKSIAIVATAYNSATITQSIGAGVANKLGITTQPTAPSINGNALAQQPVIQVQDQYGNSVSSSAIVNAAAVQGTWTLGGTNSVTASSGVATFSGLTASSNAAVSSASIIFSSSGLTSVTSTGFNIPQPDYLEMTSIGTAVEQNFDNMGTTATVTISQGFKASRAVGNPSSPTWSDATNNLSATTVRGGTLAAASSGGIYNWANGDPTSVTERALGFLTSGSYPTATAANNVGLSIMSRVKNATGSAINSISFSFDYEKYRSGTNVCNMTFFYSTNGNTWTAVSAGNHSYSADANSNTVVAATATNKNGTITGLNIANGSDIYFRWSYASGGSNAQGIGLDNFSITGCRTITASVSSNNSPVCSGNNVTFNLSGTSGAVVAYNINGESSQTITLTEGSATITINNASSDQTLNLTSAAVGNCSTSLSSSSTVTITSVSSLTNISTPAALCSGGSLNPTAPTVTANGSTVTAQGWEIETAVSSGSFTTLNVPYSVAFADNGKKIRYTATNSCGITNGNQVTLTVVNCYTLTYDANTGTGTVPSAEPNIPQGTVKTVSTGSTISKSGFNLIGWNTQANGLGTFYLAGSNITINSDITLYARWGSVAAATGSKFWIGGSGNWSVNTNWEPTGAPATGTANVYIDNGSPVMNTSYIVGSDKNLTLTGDATLTINPGVVLTITGTANFGGRPVTLKSTASGTASIGVIGNNGNNLTGATNVTVERYLTARRKWRALTAPLTGTSGNSIYDNWQNGGSVTGNTGAIIWNPTASPSASSGLYVGGNSASMLSLNTTNNTWSAVTNTKTVSLLFNGSQNNAYMLYFTGPYNQSGANITSGTTASTLSALGSLRKGNISFSGLGEGWHMIGNPYASAIRTNALSLTGLNAGGYLWNPGGSGTGVFVPITLTAVNVIQSGQAFFVYSNGGGSLGFTESAKVSGGSNSYFRTEESPIEGDLKIELNKYVAGNTELNDVAIVNYKSRTEAGLPKLAQFYENMSIYQDNVDYGMSTRTLNNGEDQIQLRLWQMNKANYQFNIDLSRMKLPAGSTAVLADAFLNKEMPLSTTEVNKIDFSVDANAASSGQRFRIVLRRNNVPVTSTETPRFQLYPNPVEKGNAIQISFRNQLAGKYTVTLFTIAGVRVQQEVIGHAGGTAVQSLKLSSRLASGTYIAEISGINGVHEKVKVVVE